MEIQTKYNPKEIEKKWYDFWESKGFFHAKTDKKKKPYSILIPPPNVTGILHMGHALNNTIQDIFIRFNRMRGYESLWMPGTDHAGIATQNVVEKKLVAKGIKRNDIGREKFIEEVWKWKEEYGTTIISQLKALGASCDWERTRFTMDDVFSDAVGEAFVRLYKKGLIYKGNYIINWCPRCHTALSDEEAEHRDVDGMLYHIKYPIVGSKVNMSLRGAEGDEAISSEGIASGASRPRNDKLEYVTVATTRPETMLGDVAICVNPKDKRYKYLKDKKAILPILGRELKIIFDHKVDLSFGTGVLKVTPAHDPVDFELGIAHKLEPIDVMNGDATMNEAAGDYKGMDRFECREALIEDLKKRKLFVKSEPHKHSVGHCYRCHTMVEPRLSKQWFVRMGPLAKKAGEVVRKGKIKFYPKRWTKVYLNWIDNIRDWCISRQIWWGHRIPVYYCGNCVDEVIVSKVRPDKCPKCGSSELQQDPDVLDTWFSSWLWPFATFGWPFDAAASGGLAQGKPLNGSLAKGQDAQKELAYFYPTNALVTAQEIIFFWVARMIMSGLEFMKDVPFKDVYIHGTVRDDTGTKMSKSLGNIIDPIDIIDQFGSDALRFSIISITAQGQDVFLSPKKFEIGRNFANKIWNASRFVLMNLKEELVKKDLCQMASDKSLTLADRWILSRFYQALEDFTKSLESYRINDAANRIYDFLWHEYCDWYLEMAKLTMDAPATQLTLYKVLEKALRVLHPVMPFITEDIWQRLPREHGTESIMITSWPHVQKAFISKKVDENMALLISIIQAIRNLRANWRVEQKEAVTCLIKAQKKDVTLLNENAVYIKRLAKVGTIEISTTVKKPNHSAVAVLEDMEIFIPLEGVIDIGKEKKRLEEKIESIQTELKRIQDKLKNKKFTAQAPKEVVDKVRERKESLDIEISSLEKNLTSL